MLYVCVVCVWVNERERERHGDTEREQTLHNCLVSVTSWHHLVLWSSGLGRDRLDFSCFLKALLRSLDTWITCSSDTGFVAFCDPAFVPQPVKSHPQQQQLPLSYRKIAFLEVFLSVRVCYVFLTAWTVQYSEIPAEYTTVRNWPCCIPVKLFVLC